MKIHSLVLLLIIIIISSRPSELPKNEIACKKITRTGKINIDSLRSNILRYGWNNNTLLFYQRYLVNSDLNISEEKRNLENIPGKFQRTFLYSILLKKEKN